MNNTIQNVNPQTKLKGRVLYVTHSKYNNDWYSIPHTHAFVELFYVISGSGQFVIRNQYIDIHEDDLIIVSDHVEHTEISKDNQPLEYIVLGIEGIDFFSEQEKGFSIHNYHEYKHEILFYIKTLLLEMKNPGDYSTEMIQNLLEILLINMMRRANVSLEVAPVKKTTKECVFIENYINEHFKEDITLDDLSEITFLNKYYLVHAFKKYKGVSPINYMVQKRIDEAKMLLETTNLSINSIASSVGFSGQSYFTQAFKRYTGVPPKQYRKDMSDRERN